jgi:hypothetical protein
LFRALPFLSPLTRALCTGRPTNVAQYGTGLQQGAFCNGDALLVGSRTETEVNVGLLSLKFLETLSPDEIKLGLLTWRRARPGDEFKLEKAANRYEGEVQSVSLMMFKMYSPYPTHDTLLKAVLDTVPTDTGTMIELFHLKPDLLRFDGALDDIELRPGVSLKHTLQTPDESPQLDYSLRAYLAALYYPQTMRITLRDVLVEPVIPLDDMICIKQVKYTPRSAEDRRRHWANVTFGLRACSTGGVSADGEEEMALSDTRGSTFYLNGRLIRFNDPIGAQKDKITGKGLHIVVDVSDTGDTQNMLLTPLPHKQVRAPAAAGCGFGAVCPAAHGPHAPLCRCFSRGVCAAVRWFGILWRIATGIPDEHATQRFHDLADDAAAHVLRRTSAKRRYRRSRAADGALQGHGAPHWPSSCAETLSRDRQR